MTLVIGENLKRLRKARDISQEELAEFLDVSFQAVSKWERGENYPDITMLPGIANFFGVSVDELLGMSEIRNKVTLNDVFKQEIEYQRSGRYKEAVQLLRDALKYYPNNYSLMSELAMVLYGANRNTESEMEAIQEAIVLCRRVWDNSKNEKIRSTSIATLCYLYHIIGENENAVAVSSTLPHVWESREVIGPDMLEDEERTEKLKKSIFTILSILYGKITALNSDKKGIPKIIGLGPDKYEKEMLDSIIHFIS